MDIDSLILPKTLLDSLENEADDIFQKAFNEAEREANEVREGMLMASDVKLEKVQGLRKLNSQRVGDKWLRKRRKGREEPTDPREEVQSPPGEDGTLVEDAREEVQAPPEEDGTLVEFMKG